MVGDYRCEIGSYQAYLNSDFGRDLAMKKFNLTLEQLTRIVGVNSKGKRKGELKGKLIWNKVTKGGWYKTGHYDDEAGRAQGFVTYPQSYGFCIVDSWSGELIFGDDRALPNPLGNWGMCNGPVEQFALPIK